MTITAPVLDRYRQTIDTALQEQLDQLSATTPEPLLSAMRHSVLLGGKRVRPALVLATHQALSGSFRAALPAACAIELIHAYSLVHDDLPAMDNDLLRRGQPTCHVAHGEAMAILAGDALQTLAFECITRADLAPAVALEQIRLLAQAGGASGMVGGQAIDLAAVGQTLTREQLTTMHRLKTGALIEASVALGASGTGASVHTIGHLRAFAQGIGLAFQIRDDILDVEGETAQIGKARGADQQLNKPTFPSILGLDASRDLLETLLDEVRQTLKQLGSVMDTGELAALAEFIVDRRL